MNINKYNLTDCKTLKNLVYILNDKVDELKQQNALLTNILSKIADKDSNNNNERVIK